MRTVIYAVLWLFAVPERIGWFYEPRRLGRLLPPRTFRRLVGALLDLNRSVKGA
jgi:hypothetical protein